MAPEPHASSNSDMIRRISAGSQTSIRLTGSPLSTGISSPPSIPMAWPTGAPTRLGLPSDASIAPSWRTSEPMVRWEWMTPLGSAVVPDV